MHRWLHKQFKGHGTRVADFFGRRGTFLLLYGFVWLIIGYNVATVRVERFSHDGPGGPLEWLEAVPWAGLLWIACGLTAIVVSLFRRHNGNRDEWGFNALLVPAFLWTGAYFWSWVSWVTSGGELGRANNWLGAAVYLIIIGGILVVAGWPDPSDERRSME